MIDTRPQECEKKLAGPPQEENGFTEGTEMGRANFFVERAVMAVGRAKVDG